MTSVSNTSFDTHIIYLSLGKFMDLISDSILLDNIMKLIPVGIFWKDKDRRFLGANQMFLDYYGLSSVDEIIGKNDEDMEKIGEVEETWKDLVLARYNFTVNEILKQK